MTSHKNTDPIALSFHESLLRSSDIELLKGPHWLNDQIISFYFEYLEKFKYHSNKDILFISPEVTQCLKISPNSEVNIFLKPLQAEKKPFIFFPLNNNDTAQAGGSHWSLLVFSRPERAFLHFDSSMNTNFSEAQEFVRKMKSSLKCPTAICKPIKTLQQGNSYDCGIHVLCATDHLSDHINRYDCVDGADQICMESVNRKRVELLRIIQNLGGKIS